MNKKIDIPVVPPLGIVDKRLLDIIIAAEQAIALNGGIDDPVGDLLSTIKSYAEWAKFELRKEIKMRG